MTASFDLAQFIGSEEVLTSSDLLAKIEASGVSSANARQLLSRNAGNPNVWRSNWLILPGGGRLFARQSFKSTIPFIQKCLPLLERHRPGIARAVRALLQDEVLLRSSTELLLGSPVIPDNSSYPGYQIDVNALVELGIAREEAADGVMERLALASVASMNAHAVALRAYSRFTVETALANLLFEQFRKQNLISWNTKALPGPSATLVVFNNFLFSATGFSWLKPMLRFKQAEKPKPTPVVLDVLAKPCSILDVEALLERMTRAGQNKNRKMTFLGILAAFDFDPLAWKLARSEGLMAINLRQYFGDDAFEALVQIQELLKNVAGEPAQACDNDFRRFAETLEQLKTNPYVVALRSLGFESVAGLILREKGYTNVSLNLKVALASGEEREVDVSGDRNGGEELFVVECKAEAGNKPLDPAYVRKFFRETVPALLKSQPRPRLRECRAEIWTTGYVGDDAQEALEELESEVKPCVKAALLDRTELKIQIPHTLESCKRLLETIATH